MSSHFPSFMSSRIKRSVPLLTRTINGVEQSQEPAHDCEEDNLNSTMRTADVLSAGTLDAIDLEADELDDPLDAGWNAGMQRRRPLVCAVDHAHKLATAHRAAPRAQMHSFVGSSQSGLTQWRRAPIQALAKPF